VAITVALGRFSDAVVTEDQETAKKCIEYLIRNKLFRLEFVPIQNVKYKEQNAALRSAGT
jgi:chromosome segregation ATPase